MRAAVQTALAALRVASERCAQRLPVDPFDVAELRALLETVEMEAGRLKAVVTAGRGGMLTVAVVRNGRLRVVGK